MTEAFTISELEATSGVPRRTIYFYVQQGILPPPSGAGLAARYHSSHLLRLRAIPYLRSRGWRLDRIRELFQTSTDETIAQLLEDHRPSQVNAPIALRHFAALSAGPERPAPSYLARYTLAPGVDLLVQRDLPPDQARAVNRLIELAAEIFSSLSLRRHQPEESLDDGALAREEPSVPE